MMEDLYQQLMQEAKKASQLAYAKYSGFKVGAALLCGDQKIYTGCNVENASYGATICAERTAALKAVSEGQKKFLMIAVYADTPDLVFPCGICRQFLAEFAAEDMKVLACSNKDEYRVYTFKELLPHAFTSF
jgi:cytidine deaminase